MELTIEPLAPADWDAVRAIYAAGIATGDATFETDVPSWKAWDAARLRNPRLVARASGQVVGWAALSPFSTRKAYSGVAEISIYVAESARGRGVGSALMAALIAASERAGIWTLQGAIFPENAASLALVKAFGFREVGRREKIAQREGVWRDTVLVERRSQVAGSRLRCSL